ncbi:MAG: TldD/PmbA family protein [Gemmatimonadales bacterium]|nr:TldD/PmbA family protein [Gemmatimonadales bacterium]NIN10073.1 TldD/PmbA family protein [Gemmatimonadales bacterium]NIQ98724.1 TldD/PmbA family protein [Gemmatimonadales bacterium]NIS63602.1 TldD/PmbA family protein [Gemmatimonadales bacterium]
MADILTESDARELSQRILSHTTADGAEVRLRSGLDGNTRFAVNQITTSGEVIDTEASVSVRFGARQASVTFNELDDASLASAVGKAERLAQLAPEDPEQMPLMGPQEYAAVQAFFEDTHQLSPERRAEAVQAVVSAAAQAGLVATGFLPRVAGATAVANTNGLFAYERSTLASYTTTVRTPEGDRSGWAGATHNDWTRMAAPEVLADRAVTKAQQSARPVAVEPGPYTVVLEPTAVGNLVQLMAFGLGARAADEGRSFFSRRGGGNKIGEQVADVRVTLYSDPQDPDLLQRPFTDEGLPVNRTVWIQDGVLVNLAYDRYWADRLGRAPVPLAGGIKLAGETGTAADLVSTVERGLLVTRFWYIRGVDPRTISYTGITRDGTFLIENGRITGAVKNLRFNESVVAMLNNIVGIGAAVRVVASESGGLGAAVAVPPLVVRDFHFTSVSDAV